jgi:hypothetical protein
MLREKHSLLSELDFGQPKICRFKRQFELPVLELCLNIPIKRLASRMGYPTANGDWLSRSFALIIISSAN